MNRKASSRWAFMTVERWCYVTHVAKTLSSFPLLHRFSLVYILFLMLLKKGIYIYIKFGRPLLLSVMLDWETVKMFSRHQSGLVSDIHEECYIRKCHWSSASIWFIAKWTSAQYGSWEKGFFASWIQLVVLRNFAVQSISFLDTDPFFRRSLCS